MTSSTLQYIRLWPYTYILSCDSEWWQQFLETVHNFFFTKNIQNLDASTEEGTKPWLYPCSNSISVHFLSCERAFNILKCVNESLCYREASLSFLDTLAVKQRPPLLVHSQEKCPSNKAFFCQISSCPAIRLSCCCCCCMWPLKLAALHRTAPHITIVYWGFEKEKEKIRVRF